MSNISINYFYDEKYNQDFLRVNENYRLFMNFLYDSNNSTEKISRMLSLRAAIRASTGAFGLDESLQKDYVFYDYFNSGELYFVGNINITEFKNNIEKNEITLNPDFGTIFEKAFVSTDGFGNSSEHVENEYGLVRLKTADAVNGISFDGWIIPQDLIISASNRSETDIINELLVSLISSSRKCKCANWSSEDGQKEIKSEDYEYANIPKSVVICSSKNVPKNDGVTYCKFVNIESNCPYLEENIDIIEEHTIEHDGHEKVSGLKIVKKYVSPLLSSSSSLDYFLVEVIHTDTEGKTNVCCSISNIKDKSLSENDAIAAAYSAMAELLDTWKTHNKIDLTEPEIQKSEKKSLIKSFIER